MSIAREPVLEAYAHAAEKKLTRLDASESDRRVGVANGDLLHALQVLAHKAQAALPGSFERSCTFAPVADSP